MALALPAAVAVPIGVYAWPGDTGGHPHPEPVTVQAEPQREAPLSRGGVNERSVPHPTTSPTVTVTTPDSTPEPTPTESPTDTPEPTPTETDTPTPEPTVTGQMYTTVALNVRSEPSADASSLAVLARGSQVDVTGTTEGDWVQVIYDGRAAWVSGDYLSETEPPPETTEPTSSGGQSSGGLSYAECPHGSAVESGLTRDAIRVHRAVCAEFPEVTSYQGVRSGGGAHGVGRALDIMVGSNSSLGDAIAAFARENHKALGVSEVIWAQRIWTVQRSSEGWRWMEDRGSTTANHYDHVHVTVYGDAGTTG